MASGTGGKLIFGRGTRVQVKPSEYEGLNHNFVSNTETGALSSIFNGVGYAGTD